MNHAPVTTASKKKESSTSPQSQRIHVQCSMLSALPRKDAAAATWSYAQLPSRTPTPTTHPQAVLCEASRAFAEQSFFELRLGGWVTGPPCPPPIHLAEASAAPKAGCFSILWGEGQIHLTPSPRFGDHRIDDHRASAAAFEAPYTGHPVSVGCLRPRSSSEDMDCSEGLWPSCAASFSSGFLHPPFSRSFKIRRDWTKIGGGGAIKATKSSAALHIYVRPVLQEVSPRFILVKKTNLFIAEALLCKISNCFNSRVAKHQMTKWTMQNSLSSRKATRNYWRCQLCVRYAATVPAYAWGFQ